jgi:hypothetical protein
VFSFPIQILSQLSAPFEAAAAFVAEFGRLQGRSSAAPFQALRFVRSISSLSFCTFPMLPAFSFSFGFILEGVAQIASSVCICRSCRLKAYRSPFSLRFLDFELHDFTGNIVHLCGIELILF